MIGLTLTLLVQQQAQGQDRVRSIPVGGSPLVPAGLVNGPVPRLPDGKPDLTGPWVGGGSNQDIERDGGLKPGELPLLPWAKALRDKRKEQDEPYVACLPMSVPRSNPYPWKFAMSYTSKGLTHIYLLHELGDDGAHRVVYMDGRKHPDDVFPTWWGHSTRSATTTSSGSIVAEPRTRSSCTLSNGGLDPISGRSSTNSPSTTPERFRGQSS
jgi:hypothetical protein